MSRRAPWSRSGLEGDRETTARSSKLARNFEARSNISAPPEQNRRRRGRTRRGGYLAWISHVRTIRFAVVGRGARAIRVFFSPSSLLTAINYAPCAGWKNRRTGVTKVHANYVEPSRKRQNRGIESTRAIIYYRDVIRNCDVQREKKSSVTKIDNNLAFNTRIPIVEFCIPVSSPLFSVRTTRLQKLPRDARKNRVSDGT